MAFLLVFYFLDDLLRDDKVYTSTRNNDTFRRRMRYNKKCFCERSIPRDQTFWSCHTLEYLCS